MTWFKDESARHIVNLAITSRNSTVVVRGEFYFLEKVKNRWRKQKPPGCVIKGKSPGVPNRKPSHPIPCLHSLMCAPFSYCPGPSREVLRRYCENMISTLPRDSDVNFFLHLFCSYAKFDFSGVSICILQINPLQVLTLLQKKSSIRLHCVLAK